MKKFLLILSTALLVFGLSSAVKIRAEVPSENVDQIANGAKVLVLNYHQVGTSFNPLTMPVKFFDEQTAAMYRSRRKSCMTASAAFRRCPRSPC